MVDEEAEVENVETNTSLSQEEERPSRLTRLPQTRIRHMMKLDPDLHLASQESVLLVTKAAVRCWFLDQDCNFSSKPRSRSKSADARFLRRKRKKLSKGICGKTLLVCLFVLLFFKLLFRSQSTGPGQRSHDRMTPITWKNKQKNNVYFSQSAPP